MRPFAAALLLLSACAAPARGPDWTADLPGHPADDAVRFDGPRLVLTLPGPAGHVLVPGAAFLEPGEPAPPLDPARITTPLVAVELDGTLALLSWTGSARLRVETGPRPTITLEPAADARLRFLPGAGILDAVPHWLRRHPLPEPSPWPRAMAAELDLCRIGFRSLQAPAGKHRLHAGRDAPADWVPGFGVLLHHLGERVDWDLYPDLLSTTFCRLVAWEAPGLAGEARGLQRLPYRVRINLGLRGEDGEWGYHPTSDEERRLGRAGDSVLGTNAPNVLGLAKAARLTGDAELRAEALAALERLRKHVVPRGGRPGERPLREPDLLAAAYALGACLEGHALAGDGALLADAVLRARSGLPFLRLDPVSCESPAAGLVFAYYLRRLAPLDPGFPWARIADGLLAQAVRAQRTDGPSAGCLPEPGEPDSNPEALLANLLALQGLDPDPAWRRP